MATQKQADDLIQITTNQFLDLWISHGKILKGWAIAQQAADVAGLALVKSGLDALQASGTVLFIPYCLGLLADTQQALGQIEDALASVAEALSLVEKTGERLYEAELHRLQGELMLLQDGEAKYRSGQVFQAGLCNWLGNNKPNLWNFVQL